MTDVGLPSHSRYETILTLGQQTTDLSLKQRITPSVSAAEAKYGSGMTDGVGHGNKTGEFRKGKDPYAPCSS